MSALTNDAGDVVVEPAALASLAVRHFAHVSDRPGMDPDAQQQVMAAMVAQQEACGAARMGEAVAEREGERVMTEGEVRAALHMAKKGRAPGPDGLPVEVWRLGGVWAPLLATLFSAMAVHPDSQELRLSSFLGGIKKVWQIPSENSPKEVLWRLAVNGVLGAGGHGVCYRGPCLCGYSLTPAQCAAKDSTLHRQHVCWDCPVAQAVVGRVGAGVGLGGGGVRQWQVWLLQPTHGLKAAVWRVVALAALDAMWVGWRSLRAMHAQGLGAAQAVHAASGRAVAAYWLVLHVCARDGRKVPVCGWEQVGPEHPFLAVQGGEGLVRGMV